MGKEEGWASSEGWLNVRSPLSLTWNWRNQFKSSMNWLITTFVFIFSLAMKLDSHICVVVCAAKERKWSGEGNIIIAFIVINKSFCVSCRRAEWIEYRQLCWENQHKKYNFTLISETHVSLHQVWGLTVIYIDTNIQQPSAAEAHRLDPVHDANNVKSWMMLNQLKMLCWPTQGEDGSSGQSICENTGCD